MITYLKRELVIKNTKKMSVFSIKEQRHVLKNTSFCYLMQLNTSLFFQNIRIITKLQKVIFLEYYNLFLNIIIYS